MKIQLNAKTGTRLISLPRKWCEAKGYMKGQLFTFDIHLFPGHILLKEGHEGDKPLVTLGQNEATGTYLLVLPADICGNYLIKGDEMALDEKTFPGHVVLRKTANRR